MRWDERSLFPVFRRFELWKQMLLLAITIANFFDFWPILREVTSSDTSPYAKCFQYGVFFPQNVRILFPLVLFCPKRIIIGSACKSQEEMGPNCLGVDGILTSANKTRILRNYFRHIPIGVFVAVVTWSIDKNSTPLKFKTTQDHSTAAYKGAPTK